MKSQKALIKEMVNKLGVKEREELKDTLQGAISLHESMKGAYFYTPPARAHERRSYEDRYSQEFDFHIGDAEYTVEQKTSCSCRNVYYSLSIYSDQEDCPFNLNISFIKKIVKALTEE